uniref:Uncharacterized protein n=1 Tax=Romanomermis culicivorax TaxID=13658 RepID=A0A915IIG5_ROMCU
MVYNVYSDRSQENLSIGTQIALFLTDNEKRFPAIKNQRKNSTVSRFTFASVWQLSLNKDTQGVDCCTASSNVSCSNKLGKRILS